ncbi:hypothetical protein ABIB44_000507 [Hymenobacter sp. UYCo722]
MGEILDSDPNLAQNPVNRIGWLAKRRFALLQQQQLLLL